MTSIPGPETWGETLFWTQSAPLLPPPNHRESAVQAGPPAAVPVPVPVRGGPGASSSSDADYRPPVLPYEELTQSVYLVPKPPVSRRDIVGPCSCRATSDPPFASDDRCGPNCDNRLMYIACTSKCVFGRYCTNRQFEQQAFAKVEVFDAGRKGQGLRALAHIAEGAFVYEYMGEVYSTADLPHRKQMYAAEGRPHLYFMNLDSDIIIDATLKGARSRFINHSCDPNCELQRWVVNKDTRVGFFAIRDIAVGEEITFDYKYERYGDDKAIPCFCGTSKCTGEIGGQKAVKAAPAGRGGKRRRAESSSSASEVEVVDRLLLQLRDTLERLGDSERGLSKLQVLNPFLRTMFSLEKVEHRTELLDVLQATKNEIILENFVARRGLYILRVYLEEATLPDMIGQILAIATELPCRIKNVVVASQLLPCVQALQASLATQLAATDGAGPADPLDAVRAANLAAARALIAKWNSLPDVFVIQRAESGPERGPAEDEKSTELPVDRARFRDLRRSVLDDIRQDSQCRIEWTADESDPVYKYLLVSGPVSRVKKAVDELKVALGQSAPVTVRPAVGTGYRNITPARPPSAPRPDDRQRTLSRDRLPSSGSAGSSAGAGSGVLQPPRFGASASTNGKLPDLAEEAASGAKWIEVPMDNGSSYFYNEKTRETSWTNPMLPSAETAAYLQPPDAQLAQFFEAPAAGMRGVTGHGDDMDVVGGSPQFVAPTFVAAPFVPTFTPVVTSAGVGANRAAATATAAAAAAAPPAPVDAEANRIKAKFRVDMSEVVKKALQRFSQKDSPYGRITNTDDFKHLARKLTHILIDKATKKAEEKNESLNCDEAVAKKCGSFVKEYMKKCGVVYVRPTDGTDN